MASRSENASARTYVCTHAQTDGQVENNTSGGPYDKQRRQKPTCLEETVLNQVRQLNLIHRHITFV